MEFDIIIVVFKKSFVNNILALHLITFLKKHDKNKLNKLTIETKINGYRYNKIIR